MSWAVTDRSDLDAFFLGVGLSGLVEMEALVEAENCDLVPLLMEPLEECVGSVPWAVRDVFTVRVWRCSDADDPG